MAVIRKKCWKKYFELLLAGKKRFDVRLADFVVKKGDTLILEEWDEAVGSYTGRRLETVVSFVLTTKDAPFWSREDLERYGLQVIQIDPIVASAEPAFRPEKDQIDYTHIRYAPVINCVVRNDGEILLVRRSPGMRLYPNLWNGISGFLDDKRGIEEKVADELREELGVEGKDIVSIRRGPVFDQEETKYAKTWIVHPILVDVASRKVVLDWEATTYGWFVPEEAKKLPLLPGFDKVLEAFFPPGS
jgi:8-oxo-dGTP pyrophosphatase MutT (NUDIX family)